MSDPPRTVSRLNIGLMEEALNDTLELLERDKQSFDVLDDVCQTNVVINSRRDAHIAMAEKLITHNVDENERASIKLVKKLAEKDRHDEIRRRIQKEKDDVATRVSAIYEIFKGTISEKDIAKVFDRHKNDVDGVIEELIIASKVAECKEFASSKPNPVKTVCPTPASIVFNDPEVLPVIEAEPEIDEEEAARISEEYAKQLLESSKHHAKSAHKHGPKDVRFGPLMAISRDEKKRAKELEKYADILKSAKVTDKIDLHYLSVERALRMIYYTIKSIKTKKPSQRELEIVTGLGNNNPRKKAVLKIAAETWLRSMSIRFEYRNANYGALFIDLHSAFL